MRRWLTVKMRMQQQHQLALCGEPQQGLAGAGRPHLEPLPEPGPFPDCWSRLCRDVGGVPKENRLLDLEGGACTQSLCCSLCSNPLQMSLSWKLAVSCREAHPRGMPLLP